MLTALKGSIIASFALPAVTDAAPESGIPSRSESHFTIENDYPFFGCEPSDTGYAPQ